MVAIRTLDGPALPQSHRRSNVRPCVLRRPNSTTTQIRHVALAQDAVSPPMPRGGLTLYEQGTLSKASHASRRPLHKANAPRRGVAGAVKMALYHIYSALNLRKWARLAVSAGCTSPAHNARVVGMELRLSRAYTDISFVFRSSTARDAIFGKCNSLNDWCAVAVRAGDTIKAIGSTLLRSPGIRNPLQQALSGSTRSACPSTLARLSTYAANRASLSPISPDSASRIP
jgi:hypothetical protein